MENTRIWGLIVIVLLVLSLAAAIFGMAGGTTTTTNKKANMITNNYTLTDAQAAGVNRVNINYVGNVTGFSVRFSNQTDNLYKISVEREKSASEPQVTYSQNGDVLDVNVTMDQGSADIVLGSRATYNGSFESKIGGYGIYLGNNSKVDNLKANIKYLGGGTLILGDTTFQKVDMNVNAGGFMISSMPNKTTSSGIITANAQMGGVTINLQPSDKQGVKVKGTADLGGFNINPVNFNVLTNTTSQLDIESTGYNEKPSKIEIDSTIGLGGITINMFDFPIMMG